MTGAGKPQNDVSVAAPRPVDALASQGVQIGDRNAHVPQTHSGPCLVITVGHDPVAHVEQVFTQCSDQSQRQAFIAALHVTATTRGDTVHLAVLVVRAIFLARGTDYVNTAIQHDYAVTARAERQLRMAIIEPAKQANRHIDDNLVEQLPHETHTRTVYSESPPMISVAGVQPLLSSALNLCSGTFLDIATVAADQAAEDPARYPSLTTVECGFSKPAFGRRDGEPSAYGTWPVRIRPSAVCRSGIPRLPRWSKQIMTVAYSTCRLNDSGSLQTTILAFSPNESNPWIHAWGRA
ncbi:hypothetical protein [Nocardia nova]|uniref:nSTAND1 domain-containing NTPase n=1 Tax=Nocardia nova TaxID=37330 RepID=UPI002692DC9A